MPDVKIRVLRVDPAREQPPAWEDYIIPLKDGMSVCDGLAYVNHHYGAGIAYYYSCLRGACKACIFKINGRSRIACVVPLEGDVVLEPASMRHVVKDLLLPAAYPADGVSGP